MHLISRALFVAGLATLLVSCAATSIKQTWKAPDYTSGPVGKVAVLAVEERGLFRQALENRFRNQLVKEGQPAIVTHDLLSLAQVKSDKEATAARLRESGAGAFLIVRLVDFATHSREVRATPALFVPVTTGVGTAYGYLGWYDYYSAAYTDMGTVWGSDVHTVYLETSLFDLASGKKLWFCLTRTVLTSDIDRLEEADKLVAKVLAAARKDGLTR